MNNATIHVSQRCQSPPTTYAERSATTSRNGARSSALRSDKITDQHLAKLAIVYVRQSTQQQVLEHRESTARQ